MRLKLLFLPLVAVLTMGQAKEGKDIYLSVPHGSFPSLTNLHWLGKLPKSGDQVGVTFSLKDQGWEMMIDRKDRPPIRVALRAKRLLEAHPERALIWASYDEQRLHVEVPYGESLEDCFANGDDVFEDIQVNVDHDGSVAVQDTRFVSCEAQHDDLPIALENGAFIIAK